MHLKNRFKDVDKMRVWLDHQYCALCSSNQGCSLHHIDGTKSSSIYNGIMLCHSCHRIADSHNTNSPLSTAYRNKLRAIAYTMVEKSGHVRNDNDKNYLAHHAND